MKVVYRAAPVPYLHARLDTRLDIEVRFLHCSNHTHAGCEVACDRSFPNVSAYHERNTAYVQT
jgi:hypothetical protein